MKIIIPVFALIALGAALFIRITSPKAGIPYYFCFITGVIAALYILLRIINSPSAQSCLKGNEPPSKVFFRWGVLLYVASLIIGYFSVFFGSFALMSIKYLTLNQFLNGFVFNILFVTIPSILAVLIGTMGFILIFIYPFLFCTALIRCAENTNKSWIILTCYASALIFIVWHIACSFYVWLGLSMIFME